MIASYSEGPLGRKFFFDNPTFFSFGAQLQLLELNHLLYCVALSPRGRHKVITHVTVTCVTVCLAEESAGSGLQRGVCASLWSLISASRTLREIICHKESKIGKNVLIQAFYCAP